jgi:hypothetical protein
MEGTEEDIDIFRIKRVRKNNTHLKQRKIGFDTQQPSLKQKHLSILSNFNSGHWSERYGWLTK